MTAATAIDVSTLTDDGDTLELSDTRRLRLVIEPDPYFSLLDEQGEGMWCGRIEWGTTDRDTGWNRRPDGFDGGAEKLLTDRGDVLWWQVPSDVERGSDTYYSLRRNILDILEYGYYTLGLVVDERCDHGTWHEVDAAYVGGVDPFPDSDYIQSLINDQLSELDI